jgi:type IV secretory pathway component VirB8
MRLPTWFPRLPKRKPRRHRRRQTGPQFGTVDHSLVRKADPYAFEAAHRRLAWMLRLAVMVCVASMTLNIVQTAAISELVPLKEVQLGLVRIEERSDKMVPVDPASLVRVLPVTKETPGFDIMLDAFVRRYVRIILEIDAVSQDDRMREANRHSDPEWWKKFMDTRLKDIKVALDSGLNRSIVVESADRISQRDGTYRYAVDFVQTDARDGKKIEVKRLRAYLPVTLRPHTVKPEEQYENPHGLRVLDLALKERGNS